MKEYKCNYCNKKYTNRQNLFRHKKKCEVNDNKFKTIENNEDIPFIYHKYTILDYARYPKNTILFKEFEDDNDNKIDKYKCDYCDKEYKFKSGKYRHQRKCKNNVNEQDEIMEEKIEELKKNMLEVLNKRYKMHHKTFEKIRRDLAAENELRKSGAINNTQNITNNTINNNTQNNYNIKNTINIIPLGKEEFVNTLSKEQQIETVNKVYNCIKHLCDITHFNPATPQYHSFVITNMQNNIAYLYDLEDNNYIPITKETLINEIIHERGSDIRDFIECNESELRESTIKLVNNFIDRLDTDKQFLKKKINELKVYVYNKTKDININRFKKLKN